MKKLYLVLCLAVFGVCSFKMDVQAGSMGAIADVETDLNIRSGPGLEHEVIGKLPADGFCYVEKEGKRWAYICSGEVKGYVYKKYLTENVDGEVYLNERNLIEPILAFEVDPKTQRPIIGNEKMREDLVEYALQFVGNPYVWGGTSLTHGADCSGFVQTLYGDFGISLPRVASAQADAGTRISVEEAQPGDLIFYANGGYIYHVVVYIGDGQVVHASSAATGIKVSKLYKERAISAARVLP